MRFFSCNCFFVFYIFLLIYNAAEAVRLRERRSTSQLKKDGANVCEFDETKTVKEVKYTKVSETKDTKVCCRKFLFCWKKCKRTRVREKTVSKTVTRLQNYKVLHCCPGWTIGETKKECDVPVCFPPCMNGGICKDPDNCQCTDGFLGKICQFDIDECKPGSRGDAKCQQQCVNTPGSFYCSCKKGYLPANTNSSSCTDINECKQTPSPCTCASDIKNCHKDKIAQCYNNVGSYSCQCAPGYRLARSNMCVDRNECFENENICPQGCKNLIGSYKCTCFPGFEWDKAQKTCKLKDLCQFKGGCEHECVPIFGGKVCLCRNGFALGGDRHSCKDINECTLSNPCDKQSSYCENYKGSYRCVCKTGYIQAYNGLLCLDRDECEEKTARCTQKCINTKGSYKCDCNDGFKLGADKLTCEDIDECKVKGRTYCSQRCINTVGSFACACDQGYLLGADKRTCYPRKCEPIIDPFYGTASCDGYIVGQKCYFKCLDGFEIQGDKERTCQTSGKWSGQPTKCLPKKCLENIQPPANGKVTLPCDLDFGSTCPVTCLEGYILRGSPVMKCGFVFNQLKWDARNTKCEEILVCKPNPCLNNGRCSIVTDTKYSCDCSDTGHVGKNCEKLLVKFSPIPKLSTNVASALLKASSSPQITASLEVYPEDPDVTFSPNTYQFSRNTYGNYFTISSTKAGLFWASYKFTADEPVQPIKDRLLFFYQNTAGNSPKTNLLTYDKNCYKLDIKTHSCASTSLKLSSTSPWKSQHSGLFSTPGMIFMTIGKAHFPVILPKINSMELLQDILPHSTLQMKPPSSKQCKEEVLPESVLQYAVLNDQFSHSFLAQFNILTPYWFTLDLNRAMSNIHEDNIRTYLWSAQKVRSHPICGHAAIDETSTFLVYLHHESINMKVNDKSVTLTTKSKFCLLVDICKQEPHIAFPDDNYGHLESMFSFSNLQSMGWKVSLKSVGFRSSVNADIRKCSKAGVKQLVFGSAAMSYNYKDSTVKGQIYGLLTYDIKSEFGKESVDMTSQCFDGRSRFDTLAWYTADTDQRRYVEKKTPHNEIKTKTKKQSSKKQMLRVIQSKNSVFKMKSGLRPILVKTPKSNAYLDFLFKEVTSSSGGGAGSGADSFIAVENLEFPLYDLKSYIQPLKTTQEPLKTTIANFLQVVEDWNTRLLDDINEYYDTGGAEFVQKSVQHHYYQVSPSIETLKTIIAGAKVDTDIDANKVSDLESVLGQLEASYKELAKYIVIKKATKTFSHLAAHFNSSMCLYLPCIEDVSITMYPFSYDMGLGPLCRDITKGNFDIWQTEGIVKNEVKSGKFFTFKAGDKLHLCLTVDGVNKARIQGGINLMGTTVRDTYTLLNNKIVVPTNKVKLYGKYDFNVNSTVDLMLKSWDMVTMSSYGVSTPSSKIMSDIQASLDAYVTNEYQRMKKREKNADLAEIELVNRVESFKHAKRSNETLVLNLTKNLEDTKTIYKNAKSLSDSWRKQYDQHRNAISKLEAEMDKNCTIQTCKRSCHNLKRCDVCQDPYTMEVEVPSCKQVIKDRSYAFVKSENSVCSHVVTDYKVKYTGNCKKPGPDQAFANSVIDRINGKIKKKEPLTLADAIDLEQINEVEGKKLRKQIEQQRFFQFLPLKLRNNLLTPQDFDKLTKYTNKTFSNNLRRQMEKIKNTKILKTIINKMQEGQTLRTEDYAKLRNIDPQLEKEIRKSEIVRGIMDRVRLLGNITEEDMKKLEKVAPEYAKEFTDALNKDVLKEMLDTITKKISNGTFGPDDIKALEKVNPTMANKLKAALKEQLNQRVKEMKNKLNSVKTAMDKSLNNTGFTDLQEQLDVLSGSMKNYNREELKKLQEKIRSSNKTSGSVFEELFERLDLGFDIKMMTGNSKDIDRAYNEFFNVLPKFDIPKILQRSTNELKEGLTNVQEWFLMAAKVTKQACDRCKENCTSSEVQKVVEKLKDKMKIFENKVCKSTWSVGSRTKNVNSVCSFISKILENIKNGVKCDVIQSKIIAPIEILVDRWKQVRLDIEELKKEKWKQSKKTLELFKLHRKFTTSLIAAYATELGSVELKFLDASDIISKVKKNLAGKNVSTNLATLDATSVVVEDMIQGIEKLPNLIKQNGKTTITVSANEGKAITESSEQIFNMILPLLQNLCNDKKPMNVAMLARLIAGANGKLKTFITAKDINKLLLYTQMVGQFTKYVVITMNKDRGLLEDCRLKEEAKSNDTWTNEALVSLKSFLTTIRPLEGKTIKQLANDIKILIKEYSVNGLESPIGKLLDLAEDFIEESPSFNLPLIISFSPKTSTIALNTFRDYLKAALEILEGMRSIVDKCQDDKCSVDDVFGKGRLSEVFVKLETYLNTITKQTRKYMKNIKQYPAGLQMVTTSLEEVQVSLKTFSESGTGFSLEGLKDIISALKDSAERIEYVKKNLKLNFEMLSGTKNKNIKKIILNIEQLQEAGQKLFDRSKISSIKKKVEDLDTLLENLHSKTFSEDTNSMQRRLEIISKVNKVIVSFGKEFKELYNSKLPSGVVYHIDKKFAPSVGNSLGDLKYILDEMLNETTQIGQEIGIDLPSLFSDGSDFITDINDMVASTGIRKIRLADELATTSTEVSKFFDGVTGTLKEKLKGIMGVIKIFKKEYEELKKKLMKYGEIYDDVESTVKEIKRGPASEIGKIKDATEDLIDSIKEYDLSLIMTADPKTIPNKISEMKQLFTSLSDSFKEIDNILRKCKSCKVEKIFGYRFLKSSAINVEKAFEYMFGKVDKLASKFGSTIEEVQAVKKVFLGMKNKFTAIKESEKFGLDTLKNLSSALLDATKDISSVQKHAESIGKILLEKDVDLEVLGGNINKVVTLLSNAANKSYEVGKQGKKVLDKALEMKNKLTDLKDQSKGIRNGPIGARLDTAKSLAEDSKELLKEFPELMKLSKETLEKAGIDTKWMTLFSGSMDKMTSSLLSMLDKTGQVLEAADITVSGIENIKDQLPSVSAAWKEVADSSWDNKIPSIQKAFKNIDNILNTAIDTTIKGASALNISLTRNDLKSTLQTVIGKERLDRYKNIFGNVSRMMNQLQQGPIPQIGKLTDSVDDFVEALDGYEFGKMLLRNPSDVRNKFTEFQQLASITGDVITDIGSIVGNCKACDLSPIFGKRFITGFSTKIESKFNGIKDTFQNIGKRVDKGLQGWGTIITTTNKISDNFKGLTKGSFCRQFFDDIADALKKSANDIINLKNGTSDIFKAIFDGDKEMEGLRLGFDKLVHQVSGVFNKSSVVLPKVGDVYESVTSIKDTFKGIVDDFENIKKGPVESRIEVLKNIGKGIKGIGKSLPIIFNQSSNVLSSLGVDSSWFRRVSGSLSKVSSSLSNVVNKTDTLLTGAGLIVKDVRNMQGLARGVEDDYQKILKAPWQQKFNILNKALEKADNIVGNVSHSADIFGKKIEDVFGVDIGVDESLTDLTNDVSGVIGNISNAVKKLGVITTDITSTIGQIKNGTIEKIGKLTDTTKEFIDNLKDYDLAEILVLSPKFAKDKFGDLKEIITESGGILRNISNLVKKHCKSCGFDKIFGKNYSSSILNNIGTSLRNISVKFEGVLDKVEKGASSAAGIINSVKGIKEEIAKLDGIGFNEDSFDKIADVLSGTSEYIQDIKNDTSNIFQLLFNGNDDLLKVSERFEGFVNDFGSLIQKAGTFSSNVADAFGEVNKIKETFKKTMENIDDLTQGPIENRVNAVKNMVDGVNSMMTAFPELLKTSPLSPKWLRGFGTKLEGVTSGIAGILNKTSQIAGQVGETIESVQGIGNTASIIGNEFKRLIGSGSIGGKLQIANNIVSKVKTLTTQVNSAVHNATSVFETLSGKTFKKTNIFGKGTTKILDDISTGISTVADRYTKFTELSKSLNEAFDHLDDDPVKFALEELPIIFNQTSNFIGLLFKDVKGIAGKLGVDLGKLNLDGNLVKSAKSFFKFADTTLTAVQSGKQLVDDFKALVNSKNFKEAMSNFNSVLDSGNKFLTNMDNLGQTLFTKWGKMKGDLTQTLGKVGKSIGLNLKSIGSVLQKGLAVGKNVLNIAANIEALLNMKEFNAETVVQAANNIVSIAKSGVDIAKQFGYNLKIPGLQNAAYFLGYVTAVIDIYRGVKGFTEWLEGACDITYKTIPVSRTVNYVCLVPRLQTANVKILLEECVRINKTVVRGYGEAKICCPTKECVYMQDPQCLYSNERCFENREAYKNGSKILDKQTLRIYNNYNKFSRESIAKEKDINIARIKLYRAQIRLNRTIAGLQRSQDTLKLMKNSKTLLKEQYRKLSAIVKRNKVTITIEKVEFNVTHFKPIIRQLPLRITFSDRYGEEDFLEFAIDSEKLKESFDSIAHSIIRKEVKYDPLPNKRRRRSLTTNSVIFEEKRNSTYWSLRCAEFTEPFILVKTIVKNLGDEISSLADEPLSDMPLIVPGKLSGAAKKQSLQLRELQLSNMESTETHIEILQRWRRSSEGILSENLGAVCTGFKDCLEAEVSLIKGFFEPTMEGYEDARTALDVLQNNIFALFKVPITKDQVENLKGTIMDAVKEIERNTYFCDKFPEMTTDMPLSKLAYKGEQFDLQCTIDGPAKMKYQWSKNGTLMPDQNEWKLLLKEVIEFDHGYYECHGSSLTGAITSNKVLVRVVEPITFKEQPEDIVLRYPGTNQLFMVCNTTASPTSSYKWWFRSYTSLVKQQVSAASVLHIKPVGSKNVGHYWCEVSNGQDIVSSRKAKLDIVRVMNRKESARVHLSVSTEKKQWRCQMPQSDESQSLTGIFEARFKSLFGASTTNSLKITYTLKEGDASMGSLKIDFGVYDSKLSSSGSKIGFAMQMSNQRAELQTKMNNFLEGIEKFNGLKVMWNQCNYTTKIAKFGVDWQTEELACSPGMTASSDVVYCVQCTPGTYDSGDGKCTLCPYGTYQPSAGQSKCIPCGNGQLTDEEGATNRKQCKSNAFVCEEPIKMVLLLDSSNSVDKVTWSNIKTFASEYVRQMDTNAVDIDLVVFGDHAKLVESINVDRVSGPKRLDLAMMIAERSLKTTTSVARKIVLTVTSQADKKVMKYDDATLYSQVKEMQYSGIEMYTIIVGDDTEANQDESIEVSSKPSGRHAFKSSSSTLPKWSTVLAKAVCRSD